MTDSKLAVVTGATGLVGSNLVDYLLKNNFKVRCITRKTSDLKWLKDKNVEIFDCGLYDKDSLKRVLDNADYLFHVAGVVKSKTELGYYRGNVETTKNLLDSLIEMNSKIKRVVIISSLTAFGPSSENNIVNEKSPMNPITRYGKSKKEQAVLAEKYKDRLPINIIYAPAVYGNRDTEIYLVFKTFKTGLMTLIGFDKKEVSIIHVFDLAEGIYLAAMNQQSAGENYFISSEKYYTWPQIGDAMASAFGKDAIRLRLPHFLVFMIAAIAQFFAMFSKKAATFNIEKAKDFVQRYWICDVQKAKDELGYKQRISLEEGMKITVEWYKERKWL